jgi:NAD-dependent dihydropyrimidine dehydrogenase PreA subunit
MKCLTVCPTNVFDEWNDESGKDVVLPTREIDCILCLVCEIICPTDAINIERKGGSEETLKALLDGE